MKKNKRILILLSAFAVLSGVFFFTTLKNERELYEEQLRSHPFNQVENVSCYDLKKVPKRDRPDLAWQQDFLKTMDPKLGRPARERLLPIYKRVKEFRRLKSGIPGDINNSWVERGPSKVGGRVRALMFDPNDSNHKKVWAGSVSGGLWYTNDITDPNATWTAVGDAWQNLAISSIAYDPSNPSIYYVSTGEGWGNSDAVSGLGIWKSTDSGLTWQHLSSTSNTDFKTTQKLVVGQSGRVIAGTNSGVYISDDYGATWSKRSDGFVSDLEVAGSGVIYAGKGNGGISGGVFKSTDNGGAWSEITPQNVTQRRVEIAVSPSNPNTIYVVAAGSNEISWFKKSTNGGVSWVSVTIPKYLQGCQESEQDFTRGQHWYDLILAVHPTNPKIVIAGGIDLNKSVDGGLTWNSISNWTGWCRPYVHADQHAIAFRPGHENEAVFGNDGGVAFSDDVGNNENPNFIDRNKGLNVTQFYACAIHPNENKNYYLGGSQDNGTHKLNGSDISDGNEVTGGDGAFCFIDKQVPSLQITSYTNNNYYYSTDGGASFKVLQEAEDGSFINPTAYDHNLGILYSAKYERNLNRVKNIRKSPKTGTVIVGDMGSKASHICVSPYTTTSSTLFVGNSSGRLFKIANADGNSPNKEEIGANNFPLGTISGIALGASESEILVVFSNYGVKSVWYTDDGGATWQDKEGNLPDMPVRWVLFNPNNRKEVLLATEVGIWSTKDFDAASPTWEPSNSGLANVRVDMLKLRESDNQVLAATHGRGLFTSDAFSDIDKDQLKAIFSTEGSKNINLGESVKFENLSYGNPDSCLWEFEGGTPASSKEQTPLVKYSTQGKYRVSLTVYKGAEEDVKVVEECVNVAGKGGWIKQAAGFATQPVGVSYIDIVDENVLWALALDDTGTNIKESSKTTDGGKTWVSNNIDITGDVGIAMIHAQSESVAWIPVFPNSAGAGGGIYKTEDGGVTWNKQTTAKFEGSDAFANVVYFWDDLNGFCMGDPNGGYFEIYTTDDGGTNWTRVPRTEIPTSLSEEYGTVGYFCVAEDGTAFFNTNKGRIFKSKDKGHSWTVIETPLNAGNKCAFVDENNGVLIELGTSKITSPKAYRTTDGGANWERIKDYNIFNSEIVYVPSSQRMYVSTGYTKNNYGASYSIDGGETWTKFDKQIGESCLAVDFWDMTMGWIGKFSSSATEGGVEKYMGTTTIPDFKVEIKDKSKREVVFTDITLTTNTSSTYEWNFGEGATPATADTGGEHTVTYSTEGEKKVKLTVNGLDIEKSLVFQATAINDIEKTNENMVKVYPNPSDNEVTIEFESAKHSNDNFIDVYKINGQKVYTDKLVGTDKKTIALSKFGKGIYLIKIKNGKKVSTHKVIIK